MDKYIKITTIEHTCEYCNGKGFRYVGYIKTSKRVASWTHDGIFKGFNTHEDVLGFIDDLKDKGIKSINIFSPEEYSKIEKIRKQGQ